MRRVNSIVHHPVFEDRLDQLGSMEAERVFCRHDLSHLLDVARVMWITALEQGLTLDREVVYAAALLHDLGRVDQLQRGVPHDAASAALAQSLLPEAGFSPEETQMIVQAILGHRTAGSTDALGQLIYQADKACRLCWRCAAENACNWSIDKKNTDIIR